MFNLWAIWTGRKRLLLRERHWSFLFNDILAGKASAIWWNRTFGLPIHTKHSNWTCCRGTPFSVDCPADHYDCHTLSVLWKCIQSWCCSHICCTCIHILMVINLWTVSWLLLFYFLNKGCTWVYVLIMESVALCRLFFILAFAVLLAGASGNKIHTKGYISESVTCHQVKKSLFAAGAAFTFLTMLLSELYYVLIVKASSGASYGGPSPSVGMSTYA